MDRYEEALEKARAEYEKARKQGYAWLMNLLEGMFPELKESEDERISRLIYCIIRDTPEVDDVLRANGKSVIEALAYLEKQKDLDKMIVVSPEVWDNAINDAYKNGKKNGEKQKEQTEELSIRLNGLMQDYVKAGKDEEEQEHRLKCYQLFWDALGDSEFFEQKEQKPAEWSEEDEKMVRTVISDGSRGVELDSKQVDWLKSLRNRGNSPKSNTNSLHWKPSEEQMRMLLAVINDSNNAGAESCHLMLQSLYADLQKLL